MIQISDRADCCGCTACASICTSDAIEMQPDPMGFLYPKVILDKCIHCGLCERVCSFNKHYDTSLNFSEPQVYAVRHKKMEEIETSRSGAAFVAVSDYVLECNGVVYGAGYSENFMVIHKRATTAEERDEFKGSKYVQSSLEGIFRNVKEDLQNGRLVLFSGTPCQVSGLSSFVGKRLRKNLILMDIICHGVPSPNVWMDYVAYIEKKNSAKIRVVNFRDISISGWSAHEESFIFDNGIKKQYSVYSCLFNKCILFRPSCAKCPYTNFKRPSDLTLGDFWGWERVSSTFNQDNKGCSLVLVNTEKGKNIFDVVKERLNYIFTTKELCVQPNLQAPTVFDQEWLAFEGLYMQEGFLAILKKYGGTKRIFILYRVLKKIRNILKM